jgi:type IV pilus assembly protein PilN
MTPPVLDLLRERRAALGQQSLLPLLAERRPLIRRGVLIGGSLVAAVLATLVPLFLYDLYLRNRIARLLPYEVEVTGLRNQLTAEKGKRDRLLATNRTLARSLTSARAASALLADLQLRTPSGIQLLSAQAPGSSLLLKGRARDPMAFARINALQVELKRSPLFQSDAVVISKVEREPPPQASGAAAPPRSITVRFEITAPFEDVPPSRQLELLQQLGSDGMASRLELLRKEELLP